MKPAPFEYVAPRSLDELTELLGRYGDDAKVLAGGQSLMPMLSFRLATPEVLIDLNGVQELAYLRQEGSTLAIGCLTRHRDVEQMDNLGSRCPLMMEGVSAIGHIAIRNRGTVGGSIAHGDPAAEWPSIALALDGEVDAVGPAGTRTISAEDFFESYFTTALAPDEIVKELRLQLPGGSQVGSIYLEHTRRHGDFAIAGAGVLVVLGDDAAISDVRVVLIGVRDTAVRAKAAEGILRGNPPGDQLFIEAAESVDADIDPVSDVHASSDFRRHLAKTLVRRALGQAVGRAVKRHP